MNKTLELALTLIGAATLIGSFLNLLFILLVFKKIEEVERRIATPGKQLDLMRYVWRHGPKGRLMRAGYVGAFFLFRKIPRCGPKVAVMVQ